MSDDDNTTRIQLPIEGMTCGGCARNAERALRAVPGVRAVEIDQPGKQALLEVDRAMPLGRLGEAIRRAGYQPGATRELPPRETPAVTL